MSLNNYASNFPFNIGSLALNGFISTHGVVNLLNIPYATIPARFKTATLLDPSVIPGRRDASHYGPRCPQPPDPLHGLMSHMFEDMSLSHQSGELDCLHLNVYAPPSALSPQNPKVPVLVWIHGGSFNTGTNATEFDGNHLVKRSMDLGKPIIVVTINYRLNILGFLSSHELIEEAKESNEIPILNQGLNDQAIALQWIQQNISHFGGDASQVTAAGESAGAASIFYLLKHGVPLFSKAIICSSPHLLFRKLSDVQPIFNHLIQAIGIDASASHHTKLQALRSYKAEDLVALIPSLPVSFPIEDPNWFVDWDAEKISSGQYWAELPSWCPEIIIGHLKDEAALFLNPKYPSDLTKEEVLNHIQHSISNPCPAEIALSVMKPDVDTPLRSLLALATHTLFIAPDIEFATRVASHPNHKTYLYSIDIVDNVPGPLGGYAWHSFGNAVFFYQPACQANRELGATADKMSDAYTSFMYGDRNPVWEEFGKNGRMLSWNGKRTGLVHVGFDWKDLVLEQLITEGRQDWIDAYRRDGWKLSFPVPGVCRRRMT
ncbi:alpha/beta-hydrolase [Aspergillus sclerotioniger CBS 115572]|uniref:Alpha/beta-hydrolase n=1 Tax=Aspergillus sclerotioniger CBS 115572 TaxID=1450535 RepID=A0A317X315_9EURO|nr:alpha/beta-hydrolase [Aspergillus sclerotioniger CBS 115572]PWY93024.1 alpha/beta-hydrolase [Aspergillus sclerotioniger CBS 115572]